MTGRETIIKTWPDSLPATVTLLFPGGRVGPIILALDLLFLGIYFSLQVEIGETRMEVAQTVAVRVFQTRRGNVVVSWVN